MQWAVGSKELLPAADGLLPTAMDGVLVVDKPQRLTSHDVVAAARRLLGEPRIGHTGTLDPLATGVLPLAIARATRLVRFFSAADKDYDATIIFGRTTDTYDVTGVETGRTETVPSRDQLVEALHRLTGDQLQAPPPFSAKKVQGQRAHHLARQGRETTLAPVPVHVAHVALVEFSGARARVSLTCSAGFYVRSFAHTLGEMTGAGACLEALRRTRSGEFGLDAAVSMEELHDPAQVAARLIPLGALLRHLPAVTVTGPGRERVLHGRELEAGDYGPGPVDAAWIRLIDAEGTLVGMATGGSRPGSLHPALVLI